MFWFGVLRRGDGFHSNENDDLCLLCHSLQVISHDTVSMFSLKFDLDFSHLRSYGMLVAR